MTRTLGWSLVVGLLCLAPVAFGQQLDFGGQDRSGELTLLGDAAATFVGVVKNYVAPPFAVLILLVGGGVYFRRNDAVELLRYIGAALLVVLTPQLVAALVNFAGN